MDTTKQTTTDNRKKKSFILYHDLHPVIDKLSINQCGKLIKAIFDYQAGKPLQTLDAVTDIVMTGIISQFERDSEKYKNTCEKRRKAGRKGGKQKVANASKCKQKVAKLADSDSDSDSDSDINKEEISLPFDSERFAEAWGQFVKYRIEQKKKMSPRSQRMALKKIQNITEGEAITTIESSIANGWTGLFPDKTDADPETGFKQFVQNGQSFNGEQLCDGLNLKQHLEKYRSLDGRTLHPDYKDKA